MLKKGNSPNLEISPYPKAFLPFKIKGGGELLKIVK
jgi:hypothetical protein